TRPKARLPRGRRIRPETKTSILSKIRISIERSALRCGVKRIELHRSAMRLRVIQVSIRRNAERSAVKRIAEPPLGVALRRDLDHARAQRTACRGPLARRTAMGVPRGGGSVQPVQMVEFSRRSVFRGAGVYPLCAHGRYSAARPTRVGPGGDKLLFW